MPRRRSSTTGGYLLHSELDVRPQSLTNATCLRRRLRLPTRKRDRDGGDAKQCGRGAVMYALDEAGDSSDASDVECGGVGGCFGQITLRGYAQRVVRAPTAALVVVGKYAPCSARLE